jgi:hypothetical protein
MPQPRFSLGQLLATPGALKALDQSNQSSGVFLSRHLQGDWGDLDDEDKELNDHAVINGGRILSAYQIGNDIKVWIITEAADDNGNRMATTLLLPSEY